MPRVAVAGVGDVAIVDYVAAVLPAEMPAEWPIEALRAQAVCIASYALSFDGELYADERSQVYNPAKRTARTDLVARNMAGWVLMSEGQIARAFYSASCGGQTYNDWAPSYLRSVSCPCDRDQNGHGRGLCQYGARVLAEQGYSWREILHYYYDAELASDWGEAPMIGSKLSYQIQNPSGVPGWLKDAVAQSRPQIVKVLDPDKGDVAPFGRSLDYLARFTFGNADNGLVYQGAAGADQWWDMVAPRLERCDWVTAVEGPNEPVIDDEQQARQIVAFELRRQQYVKAAGRVPFSLVVATGNPRLALWSILGEAVAAPGVVYARHSYGMRGLDLGADYATWHTFRHRLDLAAIEAAGWGRPSVAITEWGVDWSGDPERDGWRAQGLTNAAYMAKIAEHDAVYTADPDVLVVTPFVWRDYNWPSFTMTESLTRLYATYIASTRAGVEPLPEHETATDPAILAEKCRWWLEEEQRARERNDSARADAIRRSLIGLHYRLEETLKEGR